MLSNLWDNHTQHRGIDRSIWYDMLRWMINVYLTNENFDSIFKVGDFTWWPNYSMARKWTVFKNVRSFFETLARNDRDELTTHNPRAWKETKSFAGAWEKESLSAVIMYAIHWVSKFIDKLIFRKGKKWKSDLCIATKDPR